MPLAALTVGTIVKIKDIAAEGNSNVRGTVHGRTGIIIAIAQSAKNQRRFEVAFWTDDLSEAHAVLLPAKWFECAWLPRVVSDEELNSGQVHILKRISNRQVHDLYPNARGEHHGNFAVLFREFLDGVLAWINLQ
jgi:hypothetical protein